MKTIRNILLGMLAVAFTVACSEDNKLGDPIHLEPPYPLPEKGHSEAEDRVVDFYYKYNTFLLYDYTEEDFSYGNNSSMEYQSLPGDVKYLGAMLDLLEEVWLDLYPEEFKVRYFPFKIYLVDQLSTTNKWSGLPTYYDYAVRTSDIVIAGMNESLNSLTAKDKQKLKCIINNAYLSFLLNQKDADGNSLLDIPKEFYEISDYKKDFITNANYQAEGNPDKHLEFGYLPNLDGQYATNQGELLPDGTYGGLIAPWALSVYTTNSVSDLKHFLANMVMIGDDFPTYPDYPSTPLVTSPFVPWTNHYTWDYYLQQKEDGSYKFPRIKQKLDILENYFKGNFDLDLRAIGNKKFE